MSLRTFVLISLAVFLSLFSFSALFFSINSINSSANLFAWATYGVIFLASARFRVRFTIQKTIILLIFAFSFVLFLGHSISPKMFSFLPSTAYQFILRIADGHNHLGDLAGLAFVALLVSPYSFFLSLPAFVVKLIVMFISFSKSSFLGVFVVSLLLAFQKKGFYLRSFFAILVITIAAVSIYTREFSSIPLINTSQTFIRQVLHLNPKPLLSTRDIYFPQVIRAWETAPIEQLFFGYGPGNYIYPSMKTGVTSGLTPTETHNIFLHLFVENGILSFLWFGLLCSVIFFNGVKSRNSSIYLFTYLLVNFQTDYTYTIPFFMGIFFFLGGQTLHEDGNYPDMKPSVPKILTILFIGFALFSGIFSVYLHQKMNGLNDKLSRAVQKKERHNVNAIIDELEALTPFDEPNLVKWSSYQDKMGNTAEAVRLLEKLATYSPRWHAYYLKTQFDLQLKIGVNLTKYVQSKKAAFSNYLLSQEEEREFNSICLNYVQTPCR